VLGPGTSPLAAERYDCSRCDQLVKDQGLSEGESVGAVQIAAGRELAESLLTQVAREVHPIPDA
jgi:hypothetical protein